MAPWLLFIKLLPQFWEMVKWAEKRIREGYTVEHIQETFSIIDDAFEDTDAKRSSQKLKDMWLNRKP